MKSITTAVLPYINLLRPYQWVKNILLFTGLIFSNSLFKNNDIYVSIAAFAIFCLTSSCVYILNDLLDYENDRLHPVKKKRSIASGKVKPAHAIFMLMIGLPVSLFFAFYLNKNFFIICILYLVINTAYSFGLKKVVLVDAFIVAIGFLLRVYGGCVVIGVSATPWLFICTLSLALILSFGKRRNELNSLSNEAKNHRRTLEFYNSHLLDILITICSATAVGTYSLYTMAAETMQRFGTQKLIITMPFVMYGVFRYLYLVFVKNEGGDPTLLLVKDLPTIINGLLWVLSVVYIIYGKTLFKDLSFL
jgi:4-hydroxybenzoate polyprenyltransferase